MLHQFQLTQMELDRFRRGPLGPHLDSFASWLTQQGYSRESGMRKIRLISLLSCWLEQRKVGVQILDELQIAAFLKAQRKLLRRHHQVQHTLGQLLQHLRRSKIIPNPPPTQAENPSEQLIHDYRRFLTEERGLCQTTLANYIPVAQSFLSYVFRAKAIHLRELTAADINGFILRERITFSPKRVQLTTSALRSFLGFLYLREQLATPLAAAVPMVATWRFSEMPNSTPLKQILTFLNIYASISAADKHSVFAPPQT